MLRLVVLSWVTWGSCPRWGTHILASPCCTTSVCSWCSSTHNHLTSTQTSLLLPKLARCVVVPVMCLFVVAVGSPNSSTNLLWVHFRIHRLSFSSLQYDYSMVQSNFTQLENLCKASWEQLKILDKADDKKKGGNVEKKRKGGGGEDEASALEGSLHHRLPKLLKEYEERLKVLRAVHRRVINRCSASVDCVILWTLLVN